MYVQIYSEVQPLLPEVQYNAPARILTFRASGSRKQPRLPGEPSIVHSFWVKIVRGSRSPRY